MTGQCLDHDPQNKLGTKNQAPSWLFPPNFSPPKDPLPDQTDDDGRGGNTYFHPPTKSVTAVEIPKEQTTTAENTQLFNKQEEEKRKYQLTIRFFEWMYRIGNSTTAGVEYKAAETNHTNSLSYDNEEGSVIGGIVGLVIISAAAKIYYSYGKTPEKQPLNPFYRNLKTFYDLGSYVGPFIASLIPGGPLQRIVRDAASAAAGIIIALITLPFSLLNFNANKIHHYCKTGTEGHSKYLKTSIVLGTDLGGIVGAGLDLAKHSLANVSIDVIKDGAIGAAITFVTSLILVPLINKLTGNKLASNDGNKFRNNYVRAGITLGIAFGAIIGFILGTVICPGAGSVAGMALGAKIGAWISLGSACGGVIGGIAFGTTGHKIATALQEKPNSQNSWDYSSRTFSYVGGYIGAIIGFFLPIPGGALIGAALGGAIGGVVCGIAGIGINEFARKIEPDETQTTIPWTQRVGTGGAIGSIVGAAIGFGIGFAFGGPAGAMLGAVLCGAIGGLVGSAVGWLCNWNARRLAKKSLEKLRRGAPTAPEVSGPLKQLHNGPSAENTSSPSLAQSLPSSDTTVSNTPNTHSLTPSVSISENLDLTDSKQEFATTQSRRSSVMSITEPQLVIGKEENDPVTIKKPSTNRYSIFHHPALQDKKIGQPICNSEYLPTYH